MENNKRKFSVRVVEKYEAYRVGTRIVEAYTGQEAKALAKNFKNSKDLKDFDEHSDFGYSGLGADYPRTIKVKMSIVELDENGSAIESPKFSQTAHYICASTGELL
jgi:hypothetical protein